MQNLEQKFRCADLAGAAERALELGAVHAATLEQADYFFPAAAARLKLRVEQVTRPPAPLETRAELISYQRADAAVARTSEYHLFHLDEAGAGSAALIAVLTQALGAPTVLRKTRRLWVWRSTRIHIDEVHEVGTFVELETVLTTQTMDEAGAELRAVVHALALRDVVSCAYVDLLAGAADGPI